MFRGAAARKHSERWPLWVATKKVRIRAIGAVKGRYTKLNVVQSKKLVAA